jgi:hypothetical protein
LAGELKTETVRYKLSLAREVKMEILVDSLTHGDPASAMWNLVNVGEDSVGHAASKILNRPDLCDKISLDAAMWMSVLLGMMHAIFPESTTSKE